MRHFAFVLRGFFIELFYDQKACLLNNSWGIYNCFKITVHKLFQFIWRHLKQFLRREICLYFEFLEVGAFERFQLFLDRIQVFKINIIQVILNFGINRLNLPFCVCHFIMNWFHSSFAWFFIVIMVSIPIKSNFFFSWMIVTSLKVTFLLSTFVLKQHFEIRALVFNHVFYKIFLSLEVAVKDLRWVCFVLYNLREIELLQIRIYNLWFTPSHIFFLNLKMKFMNKIKILLQYFN